MVGETGTLGRTRFWKSKGIGSICASDASFYHPNEACLINTKFLQNSAVSVV
jgi:hypothetical protein